MTEANDQPAQRFLAALATREPPALDATVRAEALTADEVERRVAAVLHDQPEAARDHLRAWALLYHDRLDASHLVSQGLDDADGAWLHGLMHRREGDFDNAGYWFRRVGRHPLLATLDARGWNGDRGWDPIALIDACSRVAKDAVAARADLIAAQAHEFSAVLRHLLRHAPGRRGT